MNVAADTCHIVMELADAVVNSHFDLPEFKYFYQNAAI